MYDGKKIVTGLILFLAIILSPFWYGAIKDMNSFRLDIDPGTREKNCIEQTLYMRENHMELLNRWREEGVRLGKRVYVSKDGKEYAISLTATCIGCHRKKESFCDRCHDRAGVKPKCWDCHIYRKGGDN